jgi:hypothetical protein
VTARHAGSGCNLHCGARIYSRRRQGRTSSPPAPASWGRSGGRLAATGGSSLTRVGWSPGHGSGVPPSAQRHPPGEGAAAPAQQRPEPGRYYGAASKCTSVSQKALPLAADADRNDLGRSRAAIPRLVHPCPAELANSGAPSPASQDRRHPWPPAAPSPSADRWCPLAEMALPEGRTTGSSPQSRRGRHCPQSRP